LPLQKSSVFGRAADRLHMAQPPLTVTIKQIEEELGTLLIERTNRIARIDPGGPGVSRGNANAR